MSIILEVEERMKSEAEFGLFHLYVKIGKLKGKTLRELGFEVIDSNETNIFPKFHKISWEDAQVEYTDLSLLDENSDSYTQPQKLWIISKKNQPKK